MLSIGLMSGTSMDGIDAALIATDGMAEIQEVASASLSYALPCKILLKSAEFTIRKCGGDIQQAHAIYSQCLNEYLLDVLKVENLSNQLAELSSYLNGSTPSLRHILIHSADLHAQLVKKLLKISGYTASQIGVIGYHGQAMYHQPSRGISVVLGDGQYLAKQLGIRVVNDFRSQDVAAGGQGAPFAPIYHLALAIRDKKIPLAVVNCGGIANITLITSHQEEDLIAFDTGPGNGLIDQLIRQRTQGKETMDKDGQYGRQGQIHEQVLRALYEKSIIKDGMNFFKMKPPKALDSGDLILIDELKELNLPDACATLEAFTADTIATCLEQLKLQLPPLWILAGGGWHNPIIRSQLCKRLQEKTSQQLHIQTADEAGWNNQALEAQIFAYLAVRSLLKKPLSFPGTTGVPVPMCGGQIYLP